MEAMLFRIPNSLRHKLRSHIKRGGVLAYPTESCFGLGVDPLNPKAVRKIIRLKKRPNSKGLIVIGNNSAQLEKLLIPLDAEKRSKMSEAWPGRTTFLSPCGKNIPALLRGRGRDKLAVRVPAHPGARRLCELVKTPLVSSSANISGCKSLKSARDVKRVFKKNVWVLDGRCQGARRPSTIINIVTGERIR